MSINAELRNVKAAPRSIKKMPRNVIKLRLMSYDAVLLDSTTRSVWERISKGDCTLVGPIPIPTSIRRVVVIRSPHVYKKSREQFEQRIHARLILINEVNPQTIEILMKIELPAGVDVVISVNNKKGNIFGGEDATS